MKKALCFVLILLVLCVLSGCAAGPNPFEDTAREGHSIAGFWMGIWHGIISPFTFIISWFSDNIEVYEVYNTGGWYWFGFLFGFGSYASSSSTVASNRRRRK